MRCSVTLVCFRSPTCFGVDREEVLRVAGGDAITQAARCGGEVGILRLDADDGHVLWRVLHHDRVVDGIRGEGSVVIDVFYLRKEDWEGGGVAKRRHKEEKGSEGRVG